MPPKNAGRCIGVGERPNFLRGRRGRRLSEKAASWQVFMGPVGSLLKNRQPKYRLKLPRLSGAGIVKEILLL